MPHSQVIVRGITDATSFYKAAMLGETPPATATEPLGGFGVQTTFWNVPAEVVASTILLAGMTSGAALQDTSITVTSRTDAQGRLMLPAPPPGWVDQALAASILITDGGGNPVYRSAPSTITGTAHEAPQSIWIYEPFGEHDTPLPLLSATLLDKFIGALQIPGFVLVTSNYTGIKVTNDRLPNGDYIPGNVVVEITMHCSPDTTPVLTSLLELDTHYNISVSGSDFTASSSIIGTVMNLALTADSSVVNTLALVVLARAVGDALAAAHNQQATDQFIAAVTPTIAHCFNTDAQYPAGAGNTVGTLVSARPRLGYPRELAIG